MIPSDQLTAVPSSSPDFKHVWLNAFFPCFCYNLFWCQIDSSLGTLLVSFLGIRPFQFLDVLTEDTKEASRTDLHHCCQQIKHLKQPLLSWSVEQEQPNILKCILLSWSQLKSKCSPSWEQTSPNFLRSKREVIVLPCLCWGHSLVPCFHNVSAHSSAGKKAQQSVEWLWTS